MDLLYRVVSGQVYPGTLTYPMLELPHGICLGALKHTMHSSQEFMPSRTFHIQADCILPTTSGFEKPVTYFHCGVCTFEYPLPTEWGICAMATSISDKMAGSHVEDSLSPWTQTNPPSLSHLCPYCNRSHNSRNLLMNHIQLNYRMVLVCPICGSCGSNQWRIVEGHIKKRAVA